MMYIISKSTCGSYNVRDIQCNVNWTSCPYEEDYAVIPDDLVDGILATQGYCDITLNSAGTSVVAFTARSIPSVPEECCGTNTVLSVNGVKADANGNVALTGVGSDGQSLFSMVDSPYAEKGNITVSRTNIRSEDNTLKVEDFVLGTVSHNLYRVTSVRSDGNVSLYYLTTLGDPAASGAGINVSAAPGQLIVVKEVDEDGLPTAWKAVDRTHWEEVAQQGVNYSANVSFKNGMASLGDLTTAEIIEGKTYTVTWKGTEYECTAVLQGSVMLGNLSIMDVGNNSGEPFCIEVGDSGSVIWKSTTTNETVALTIYLPEISEIHKLDAKYLPDGVGDNELFVFDACEDDSSSPVTYSTDKTALEIYEAYRSGKIPVCRYNRSGFPVVCQASLILPETAIFYAIFHTAEVTCIVINGSNVTCYEAQVVTQEDIPSVVETALAEAKASGDFKGDKGDKGDPGNAGTSVTVKSVSESTVDGGSNVVTFSDGKKVNIKNGINGTNGTSATHSWSGTTLTVTSASGTSSANLKGDKGDTGAAGTNGTNGVSVSSVKQTTTSSADGGSNVVTVTLSNGTTSTFIVKNGSKGSTGATGATGAAGKTPVKGVDYWTTADQEAIVQQVIAALGTPVFGRVDADNNIILSGDLADGTYTLKYEDAEGNLIEIGELDMGGITNLADPSSADWLADKRLNSSGSVATQEHHGTGGAVTNFIPCKAGDVIRVKNFDPRLYYSNATTGDTGRSLAYFYASNKSTIIGKNIPADGNGWVNTNGIWTYTVGTSLTAVSGSNSDIRYARLTGIYNSGLTAQDVIITVNEEIV